MIYTKKGDRGKTGVLTSHEQVSKNSSQINAIGTVDELNSYLGVVIANTEDEYISVLLEEIQKDLFTVGSILAGSKLRFYNSKTKKIEKEIDKIEGELSALRNFIIPGGSRFAANLHYARSVSRRSEREVVAFSNKEKVNPKILIYLNRLSDLLFMLARKANYNVGKKETVWSEKKM